ncbi:MAG: TolC family protein [Chlorobiales bacterium]|nr:TolC family protein [Chlorobiales bacterium]
MNRTLSFCFLFLFCGVQMLYAQSEKSVDELVQAALQMNPSLKAFRARVEASHTLKDKVSAWSDPKLMIDFWKVAPDHKSVDMIMLGLTQEIPISGVPGLDGERAERLESASRFEELSFKRSLVKAVRTISYRLFLIDKKIELLQESRDVFSGFVKINLTKNAVGEIPQASLLKSQVELSRTENELFRMRQEKTAALAGLTELTGEKITAIRTEPQELDAHLQDSLIQEDSLVTRLNRNPDLLQLRERIDSQKLGEKIASRSRIPNIEIGVGYMYSPMTSQSDLRYTLGLNLPIFGYSASKYQAMEDEAKLMVTDLEEQYQARSLQLRTELAQTLADLRAASQTSLFYKTVVMPQTESTFKSATVAYGTAKVDFLTLLDAYLAVREAKTIYYESLTTFMTAKADLERLTQTENEP